MFQNINENAIDLDSNENARESMKKLNIFANVFAKNNLIL